MAETLKKVFGIDLGTTYSCIAYVDEYGKPVVVPNLDSERITPSVVFFDGDNVIVGTEAKRNARLNPSAVLEMVKRSMGDANWLREINGQTYRPEVISSFILRKLVNDAKQVLGEEITDVVITCPAWFGINQREATAKAGEIAGLNVRSIINEPTAAAISYGMHQTTDQVVLVYDLGGGTFDITMIEVKQGAITVLGTGGDHFLGGRDWDTSLVGYVVSCFQEKMGSSEDILMDPITCQDLILNAEAAKKSLSQRPKAPFQVSHAGQRVTVELTREKFDELTASLLERTISFTHAMLKEAETKGHTRFDKILLVGGSTRMPQVSKRLKEEFMVDCEMFDPDECVAKGAAIYGRTLAVGDEVIKIIEQQTGNKVENLGEVQGNLLAQAKRKVGETFGLPKVELDRVGKEPRNVTSKTFGIKAIVSREPDVCKISNLILRNDPVPADVTKTFYTVQNDQEDVEAVCYESLQLEPVIELEQGTQIGKYEMKLPASLPEGSPIEVNFKLNKQGRLEGKLTTGNSSKTFEIQTESVMSKDEVEVAKKTALSMRVS